MIVEDVDDDAATVAEFWLEALPALPGVGAVLGKTVYAAVQQQTTGKPGREVGRDGAFDEVAHQTAELQFRVCPGKVEVDQVIQDLRILLCSMRSSKAISDLLTSCCISSAACVRSTAASSI